MEVANVILSDSIAFIKSVELAFENEINFLKIDSIDSLENEYQNEKIGLLIVDVDSKFVDPTLVISCLDRIGKSKASLIFLASELTLLDLNKKIEFSLSKKHKAEWLIKPCSKNDLLSAFKKLNNPRK